MYGRLAILGAGGHAKMVVDTAMALGFAEIVILDDDRQHWGQQVLGFPVYGPLQLLANLQGYQAIMGIGSNSIRSQIDKALLGIQWITLVHPKAYVARQVELHPGVIVAAGAVVQPNSVIGRHSILNTCCSVDHDCGVAAYCHIAPGARLAGQASLGEGALIGVGASVLPGCAIGQWSVVGGGAVVTRHVGRSKVVCGVPARAKEA